MTLSEELEWRGFANQTTYPDVSVLDDRQSPITFYWGVDPSADSMTVGHLSIAMMVRHFIEHGHRAVLLVGGATGLIGDPDGKKSERELLTPEQVQHNKDSIAAQYKTVFAGQSFEIVDNYEWFKDMGYLDFLRTVGKHVPIRQMLGRDFVQSRLGEAGTGISYAEFSYSLIQGYDFWHLFQEKGVTLQVCGADQWGNSVTGVDLIRRIEGQEAHVWSAPLIINKSTGVKFGKSEAGAIWLDPAKTSPTQFYQFWINTDDQSVEDYLKIYTLLNKDDVDGLMTRHREHPEERTAQTRLAHEVAALVHGEPAAALAETVTGYLTGQQELSGSDTSAVAEIKKDLPTARTTPDGSIVDALMDSGLASSKTEARRLLSAQAISINNQKVDREQFSETDFNSGVLLLRRGKKFKDSALVELG